MVMTGRRRTSKAASTSGTARFLLRLPADLHRRLVTDATGEGLSLNEYCVQRLAAPEVPLIDRQTAAALMASALSVAGRHLRGVLVHGSWARGEARDSSDIDVMVVVDPALPLSRDLYRAWDAVAPASDGRVTDAHFVHPPAQSSRPGSVWCELAVEGILLGDHDGAVSRWLLDVRRAIASGRLVRKTAHGQPYWTEAA